MKACVLHAVADLRVENVPDPYPKPGEVRVKVGACGVCGSDLPRVFTKGTYRFPTIPGHEFAGVIDAVGDGVDESLIGRVAAVYPLLPCRACEMCAQEQFSLCANYDYLGSRSDGAFAEWVCAPVWNLALAPAGLSPEVAALTEPAAVALHALDRGEIAEGDRVAIYGAGPIGLLCALWARALGAADVWIADIDPEKLDRLKALGFARTCNAREYAAPAWVYDETNGGADLVIDATGVAKGAADAMHSARSRGRLVLLGNPAGDMTFPQDAYWQMLRKELDVTGTWNSRFTSTSGDDWHRSLTAMASGALDVSSLVTHRVALPDLPATLAAMREGLPQSCKVLMVNPG